MFKRISSTVCLWGLVFASLFYFKAIGGLVLLILAAVGTQYEFYKLLNKIDLKPLMKSGLFVGLFMMLSSYFFVKPFNSAVSVADLMLVAIIFLLLIILKKGSVQAVKQSFVPTLLGVLYIPFMFSITIAFVQYFTLLLGEFSALTIILWIVAVSKFSDVGGLIVGCAIGKNLLSHEISPKKTYEGLIGGILGSVLIGCTIYLFFTKCFPRSFNIWHEIFLSIVLSILALMGDLLESAIKRLVAQKDSGSLIPGIGGIFDLTDSLIFTLPIGALLISLYK